MAQSKSAALLLLVGISLRLVPLWLGAPVPHPDVSLHEWLALQYFWSPESALLTARWVNALCGCATLLLVGGLGREVYGKRVGLIALGLATVSVLAVSQSPVAGLDVPMTMWYLAAVWAAVRLVSHPTTQGYLWAGVLVGLAASTKYHGALAASAIVAAHLLCGRSLKDRRLWIAGAATVGSFLAGSPYILWTPSAFISGFTELVTHARTGLLALGPGWIHHILFSLRVNLGWPGLTALLVGLVLALGGKDSRPRVLAAGFLGYYLVVGASPLVFARYALPLAMLQCMLGAAALHWLSVRTLKARWAWITAIAIVAGPSAYASLRVADLLCATDTRAEAVDWIEAHVPPGARLCNFGSWSADPPLVTVTGIWWQVRRYMQQQGMEDLTALLPTFEGIALPRPAYEYALQPGWQHYEAGNLRAIDEFQCDYVLTNSHSLSPVRLDSTFLQQLPETARQVAWFTPTGWGPQQLSTTPSTLSARFVRRDPKFRSGRSMPPGPYHREIGRRLPCSVAQFCGGYCRPSEPAGSRTLPICRTGLRRSFRLRGTRPTIIDSWVGYIGDSDRCRVSSGTGNSAFSRIRRTHGSGSRWASLQQASCRIRHERPTVSVAS